MFSTRFCIYKKTEIQQFAISVKMFHVKHCDDFSNNTRFKTISYSNKHYFFYKIIECIG